MSVAPVIPEQPCEAGDAPGFVELVNGLIRGSLLGEAPAETYLIKIDNWFGDRWVSFSHKLLGVAGVRSKDPARPRVLPPFVPSRVISEQFHRRMSIDPLGYEPQEDPVRLHVHQCGEENGRRRLERLCPEVALFWWSGDSIANGKGSVMAYLPSVEGHSAWYVGASLEAREWRVSILRGLGRPALDRLLATGRSGAGPIRA